ncbi:MAG: hypothetical protein LQ345_006713, partial [Seirophora villosa]
DAFLGDHGAAGQDRHDFGFDGCVERHDPAGHDEDQGDTAHGDQRELPLHGQSDDEGTEEGGERLDQGQELIGCALVDFVAVSGDLRRDGPAVLDVKIPDLLPQHAGKKGSSQRLGHPDRGNRHQDVGCVDQNEASEEEIDEIQDIMVHLALEVGGRDAPGRKVGELGGKGAEDDGHQRQSGPGDDSTSKRDDVHGPAPSVCVSENPLVADREYYMMAAIDGDEGLYTEWGGEGNRGGGPAGKRDRGTEVVESGPRISVSAEWQRPETLAQNELVQ